MRFVVTSAAAVLRFFKRIALLQIQCNRFGLLELLSLVAVPRLLANTHSLEVRKGVPRTRTGTLCVARGVGPGPHTLTAPCASQAQGPGWEAWFSAVGSQD